MNYGQQARSTLMSNYPEVSFCSCYHLAMYLVFVSNFCYGMLSSELLIGYQRWLIQSLLDSVFSRQTWKWNKYISWGSLKVSIKIFWRKIRNRLVANTIPWTLSICASLGFVTFIRLILSHRHFSCSNLLFIDSIASFFYLLTLVVFFSLSPLEK